MQGSQPQFSGYQPDMHEARLFSQQRGGKQPKAKGLCIPATHFRLDGFPLSAGADMESRRAMLRSVDSNLSTGEYLTTPEKLFTEPARVEDPSPFNVQTLDYLGEEPCEYSPRLLTPFPGFHACRSFAKQLLGGDSLRAK